MPRPVPPPEPDEALPRTEALSRRLAGGDAGVLTELHARVAPALMAWALVRIPPPLRGRLEPSDVVQEVVCRVLARRGEFDPARGTFRAWTFGFARVVLHEALRRCAREPRAPVELGSTSLPDVLDEATSLTQRLARDESLRRLAEHACALEPEDRRLLLLRGLEGREHDDVGEELGISGPAAAKRWQRLRERLGPELERVLSA